MHFDAKEKHMRYWHWKRKFPCATLVILYVYFHRNPASPWCVPVVCSLATINQVILYVMWTLTASVSLVPSTVSTLQGGRGALLRLIELLNTDLSPVALKNISVVVSIREFVAGVSATLHYKNEENVALEVFFVFPMDEDSAVHTFEALVDGKKIVAELQDKTTVLEMESVSLYSFLSIHVVESLLDENLQKCCC